MGVHVIALIALATVIGYSSQQEDYVEYACPGLGWFSPDSSDQCYMYSGVTKKMYADAEYDCKLSGGSLNISIHTEDEQTSLMTQLAEQNNMEEADVEFWLGIQGGITDVVKEPGAYTNCADGGVNGFNVATTYMSRDSWEECMEFCTKHRDVRITAAQFGKPFYSRHYVCECYIGRTSRNANTDYHSCDIQHDSYEFAWRWNDESVLDFTKWSDSDNKKYHPRAVATTEGWLPVSPYERHSYTCQANKVEKKHGSGNCPDGWELYNESCYRFEAGMQKSWLQAAKHCKQMYAEAYLPTVKSYEDNAYMLEMMNRRNAHNNYWIGLYNNGGYKWHNRSTFDSWRDFSWWDRSNESYDCTAVYVNSTETIHKGQWQKAACTMKKSIICEMPLPSGSRPRIGVSQCETVECRSQDYRHQMCEHRVPMSEQGKISGQGMAIELLEKYSYSDCRLNQSYGMFFSPDSSSMWVTAGCQGRFKICNDRGEDDNRERCMPMRGSAWKGSYNRTTDVMCWSDCAQYCNLDEKCSHWKWDQTTAECFLQTITEQYFEEDADSLLQWISGTRDCYRDAYCPKQSLRWDGCRPNRGEKWHGKEIYSTNTTSWTECGQQCYDNIYCSTWSYNHLNSTCTFYNKPIGKTQQLEYISGDKHCKTDICCMRDDQ